MKDEFTWIRGIILISSGVLALSLFVRVCVETAQQRAILEAATVAAIHEANNRKPVAQAALLPPCRIVPTDWIQKTTPIEPE